MARWRLIEPHYLEVLDCFWEEKSVDRETGRPKTLKHPVPMHLDPKAPSDWNYKPNGSGHITTGGNSFDEGAIVVCWEGKGERRDIVFVGNPTPGMEPIDDEAIEISAQFSWKDPINEFDIGMTYSEKLIIDLQSQVATALTHLGPGGVTYQPNQEMMDMQRQMMEMQGQVAQALAMIAGALTSPDRGGARGRA